MKLKCKTWKPSLLVWVTEEDDTGVRSDTPVTKYYSLLRTWQWVPGNIKWGAGGRKAEKNFFLMQIIQWL